ncbi:Hypothetical protein D9617_19g102480 [Elsinoe fawcettii]|nr:Hypothetical protein D9617_19g102480 [Elsinoe fawcettii]
MDYPTSTTQLDLSFSTTALISIFIDHLQTVNMVGIRSLFTLAIATTALAAPLAAPAVLEEPVAALEARQLPPAPGPPPTRSLPPIMMEKRQLPPTPGPPPSRPLPPFA